MAQDIDIYHIEHHGLLVGTLDNITVDAPVGTIMKIEGRYIKCTPVSNPKLDCHRCACHHDNGAPAGLCSTLTCMASGRDDHISVYFEVIDINEETRKEGRV